MTKGIQSIDVDELSGGALSIKRFAEPSEVSELIAWLLCDASAYITGSVQICDGGGTG